MTVHAPILWGARIDGEVYGRGGDAPWDAVTWDTFEQHAGKRVSIVHWGQPFGQLDLNALKLADARGAVSLISVDAPMPLTDVAIGKADDQIKAFAEKCATYNRRLILRPFWEFNGTWYRWGRSAAFVEAWRRYVGIVRAAAPRVEVVWCANTIWDPASDPAPWFPGQTWIDWTGMDGYNRNEPWKSPYSVFKPTYDRLLEIAPKRPIMICETGCTETGGSKPSWINNLFRAMPMRFPRVRALVYFNWNIREAGVRRDWQIESSRASQAAFAKGVAADYFRSP